MISMVRPPRLTVVLSWYSMCGAMNRIAFERRLHLGRGGAKSLDPVRGVAVGAAHRFACSGGGHDDGGRREHIVARGVICVRVRVPVGAHPHLYEPSFGVPG